MNDDIYNENLSKMNIYNDSGNMFLGYHHTSGLAKIMILLKKSKKSDLFDLIGFIWFESDFFEIDNYWWKYFFDQILSGIVFIIGMNTPSI